MQPENLKASFTKRYVVAISLIALLSTGAFYILHFALITSDSTALIVNMSGKQRMLSQRVASLSQQYYLQTYRKAKTPGPATVRLTLQATIHEMRRANEALSSGHLNNETTVKLSNAVSELYFGEINLKNRVEGYLRLAEHLLEAKKENDARAIINELLLLSNTLLPDLNSAVLQYQQEGEDNITSIRHLEMGAWFLTLFTLMLEALFIFQPMANMVRELFQKNLWYQQDLEQEIKIRTLSLEQANLKLLHIASHDPLTGLKNRLNLEKDLESLLIHHRDNHVPYAVVMLDLDWFKKINDTYGHDVGDFVLCEVAKILTKEIREQDSVYRAGGEEFVILFNRITKEQALKKTEKIRLIIQEHPFAFNHHTIHITISGGLYHPDSFEKKTVQEILKDADIALYDAKRLGRNRIVAVGKIQE